jgi:uncharacterized caspase-like protein
LNRWVLAMLVLLGACALAGGVDAQQPAPQRYALLVGIDDYYEQGVAKLNYAAKDVESLGDRLRRQGYLVTTLPNANATRLDIVGHLLMMQETLKPQDTFVLYYAGHGLLREANHHIYWLNYKGDPRRPDLEGLRLKHVAELVSEISARRKLILLDHCYSGADAGSLDGVGGTGRGGSTTGSIESTPAAVSAASREAIPAQLLMDIQAGASARESGEAMFIVAASRGAALEFSEDQHGLFTYVLLRALAEDKADTGKDGGLSIYELNAFVLANVDRMANERGYHQKTLATIAQTTDFGTASWQPFYRKLSQSEIDTRKQNYRERLQVWSSKGLLSPQVQTLSEQLLLRWKSVDPPNTLEERDEKTIASIRWLLDNVELDDSVAAPAFSERIRNWGEP